MSSIIEIAARAELLRRAGHHPARDFIDRIERGSYAPVPPRSTRNVSTSSPNESSAPPPAHSYEGQQISTRRSSKDD
jgi:hypothetical protein